MTEHFNKLTPAEAERLAMLAEECGEVIQIVGKILRHGYDSEHPVTGKVNRELLHKEMCDVLAVFEAMVPEVSRCSWHELEKAWEKKLLYAHHQEPKL